MPKFSVSSSSPELLNSVAEYFKVLSEVSRLTILDTLRSSGQMNVKEIGEVTGLGQANLSKHLKVLTQAGLLRRQPIGVSVYYEIADPIIFDLCELVCGQVKERIVQQVQYFDDLAFDS
jgi:DNA-binding transcriptional ArsR family regulator